VSLLHAACCLLCSLPAMRVIIDGEAVDPRTATISVFDWAVFRGMGAFEVLRSIRGLLLHSGAHFDRLERSVGLLHMPSIDRRAVEEWASAVAAENDDGLIRVVITAGGRDAASEPVDAPPRVIVVWEPLPILPEKLSLLPLRSPWHPATDDFPVSGVKWLSYAPNMVSTDLAVAAGFDDALLVTMDDVVLEMPTSSIAWVAGGRLVTPSVDLGILLSITRDAMFTCAARVGIEVVEGRYRLDELLAADEVISLSTGKLMLPVGAVGDTDIPVGPIAAALAAAYADLIEEELG
jgi:branched-subunit amino acid aminotransferase/4-amino-4-deoxychorismate lyase